MGLCGIWLAWGASPSPAPAQDSGEVIFMAYNLKNYLPRNREGQPPSPKPEKEIAALVALIASEKPDILGVCEIGDEPELRDLQQRLKAAGVDLPETELVRATTTEPRNLALLSRHPITTRHSRRLLTYRLGDQILPMQRGLLDVEIALPSGGLLRLVGLHLKSQVEDPVAEQELMRRNEAALVRAHVDAILRETPETRLLVYGDLNDTKNTPSLRALRGRPDSDGYLEALDAVDSRGDRWTHYWDDADEYARFDFLLVSKALKRHLPPRRARIVDQPGWRTASDHRPLVVNLAAPGKR